MFCRQQVADLAGWQSDFSKNGAELVVIGCGEPGHIKEFRKVTGYGGKILTDPSREAFKILGLTSSLGGLLGRKMFSRAISALRQGVKPGSLQGNALQLGGAVIINSDESIQYIYRSVEAADDPPVREMLAAVA
ncbi:MAG: peroxiredoxin-like family protein [Desulfopila sp.]